MADDQALSAKKVAKRLDISPNRVRGLIRAGVLHAADISGGKKRPTYRVSPEELERWLAGEKRK
jgi:hypothetical protein